jgi:hypothetical protein
MKKIDSDQFLTLTIKELDNFTQFQANQTTFAKKTFEEWFDAFTEFCGIKETDDDEYLDDEYDDELYYGQNYQFEDIVNRRKYRSFRDDDSY